MECGASGERCSPTLSMLAQPGARAVIQSVPMRRIRATFLLRCVILAACVGLFACVVYSGMGLGWTVGTLVFAAALWFVCIECDLLPLAIECVVVRCAARGGKPVSSIWFVDLDRQRVREMNGFHGDTRDNPTIR
jgi:hypothetical protein